ncbi:MAG TPA: NfeD family protein [Bacteroidales bacterium]|nr:NfeD family protein [Bacteroidales bacterium]HOH15931.1 NfeD family protein [Bacteroidales bacterium]HOR10116.1 NfeD family protein [Bacteroidales bacterium]HPH75106.1 NfeD family protein [Bacteroidales bacterium]HPK85175.1 NfeD family protein [Bacteroidales bacterium]
MIIFLIFVGLLLFVIEFMLIPGVTIAGIGGAICLVTGIVMAFISFGTSTGMIVLGVTALVMVVTTVLMLRAKTWSKFMLKTAIDSKVDTVGSEEGKVKPGDRGTTVTRLAPGGKVLVNGEYFEAKSVDLLIDPKQEIEVIRIEDNKLIVKPINN